MTAALLLLLLSADPIHESRDGGPGAICATDDQCGQGYVCQRRKLPDQPEDKTCAPGCRLDKPNCPARFPVCAVWVNRTWWRCQDPKTGTFL